LGTLLAYRGIAHALGKGQATSYTPEVKPFLFSALNAYLAPINKLTDPAGNLRMASLWFIVAVVVMSFVLMRTRYGNWTFAVGGNPGAALAQGVNLKRVKLINFVISGLMAGLAGAVLFAQRCSMVELLGEGLELTVVAACVIGGISLDGGIGTIVGAALGMLLLSMLQQGLVLMGVSTTSSAVLSGPSLSYLWLLVSTLGNRSRYPVLSKIALLNVGSFCLCFQMPCRAMGLGQVRSLEGSDMSKEGGVANVKKVVLSFVVVSDFSVCFDKEVRN